MTWRVVTHADLTTVANELSSASVVVLVATAPPWGAAAWELARAATVNGRRVALVDLCLDRPALDADREREGVADAFLHDTPLTQVALAKEPDGLFLVPAGSRPPDPALVWRHPRWIALARGFTTEGALLMLVLPPDALEHLSVAPDRMLVLGNVADPATLDRALARAGHAAVPAIHVVDRPPAAPRPQLPRPGLPPHRRIARRSAGSRWAWHLTVGALAAGGAIAVGVIGFARSDPPPRRPTDAPARAQPLTGAAPGPAVPRTPTGDSLFYSVQIAAFESADKGLERVDELRGAGWLATLSPVRLGRQGTWFRLLVGAYRSGEEADRALRRLWEEGAVEPPSGTILRTPLALAFGTYVDSSAAEVALAGLRADGIAAYIVGSPDGRVRLYAGAFESPDQAERADSMIQHASAAATVVPRVGRTR